MAKSRKSLGKAGGTSGSRAPAASSVRRKALPKLGSRFKQLPELLEKPCLTQQERQFLGRASAHYSSVAKGLRAKLAPEKISGMPHWEIKRLSGIMMNAQELVAAIRGKIGP